MDAASEAPAQGQPSSPPVPPSDLEQPKHRVKIDGEEIEVTTDELYRGYSHSQAANRKFQEASAIRDQVNQILASFENGDLSFLERVVPKEKLLKYSEENLQRYLDYQNLTPEAREALEVRLENEKLKSEKEERDRRDRDAQLAKEEQLADEQIEKEFVEAVKGLGKDAKVTPRLIRRIAEQMQAALEASEKDPSIRPITAKQAAERAYRGIKKDFAEYLETADLQEVMAALPRKVRDALRKADLESVGAQIHKGIRQSDKASIDPLRLTEKAGKKKKMHTDDWFKAMEKRLK